MTLSLKKKNGIMSWAKLKTLIFLCLFLGMFSIVDGLELSNGVVGKLGGGVPLTLKSGVSVGSIGIAGATTAWHDEQIALAAAAEINRLMEKAAASKVAYALTLDEAMATNPSSKDPADAVSMRCPLIPAKFSEAPAETAMIYWERSRTLVAPGLAIDSADMVERPVMKWNADPNKLYTVISINEGIPALQDDRLGFLHWVVTNVPGDKVSLSFTKCFYSETLHYNQRLFLLLSLLLWRELSNQETSYQALILTMLISPHI